MGFQPTTKKTTISDEQSYSQLRSEPARARWNAETPTPVQKAEWTRLSQTLPKISHSVMWNSQAKSQKIVGVSGGTSA